MEGRKPGVRPGTPSPMKKQWVIRVDGQFIRIEGLPSQPPPGVPTYFENSKSAQIAAQHIAQALGMGLVAELLAVNRKWLLSVARGEITGLRMKQVSWPVPIVRFPR